MNDGQNFINPTSASSQNIGTGNLDALINPGVPSGAGIFDGSARGSGVNVGSLPVYDDHSFDRVGTIPATFTITNEVRNDKATFESLNFQVFTR